MTEEHQMGLDFRKGLHESPANGLGSGQEVIQMPDVGVLVDQIVNNNFKGVAEPAREPDLKNAVATCLFGYNIDARTPEGERQMKKRAECVARATKITAHTKNMVGNMIFTNLEVPREGGWYEQEIPALIQNFIQKDDKGNQFFDRDTFTSWIETEALMIDYGSGSEPSFSAIKQLNYIAALTYLAEAVLNISDMNSAFPGAFSLNITPHRLGYMQNEFNSGGEAGEQLKRHINSKFTQISSATEGIRYGTGEISAKPDSASRFIGDRKRNNMPPGVAHGSHVPEALGRVENVQAFIFKIRKNLEEKQVIDIYDVPKEGNWNPAPEICIHGNQPSESTRNQILRAMDPIKQFDAQPGKRLYVYVYDQFARGDSYYLSELLKQFPSMQSQFAGMPDVNYICEGISIQAPQKGGKPTVSIELLPRDPRDGKKPFFFEIGELAYPYDLDRPESQQVYTASYKRLRDRVRRTKKSLYD